MLSDYLDEPGSICRHGKNEGDCLEGVTKHAIIMDLEAGRMSVGVGVPCSTEYTFGTQQSAT